MTTTVFESESFTSRVVSFSRVATADWTYFQLHNGAFRLILQRSHQTKGSDSLLLRASHLLFFQFRCREKLSASDEKVCGRASGYILRTFSQELFRPTLNWPTWVKWWQQFASVSGKSRQLSCYYVITATWTKDNVFASSIHAPSFLCFPQVKFL